MSKQIPNILCQGAEAVILHEGSSVIKDRISKSYRHPALDKKIIRARTKSEAKILEKAAVLGISPQPTEVESNKIIMPFIEGKKLSEHLEQLDWKSICKTIGSQIARLHDANIIHGDLTTSNMILVENHPALKKDESCEGSTSKNTLDITKNKKEVSELVQETSSNSKTKNPNPKLYFIDFGLSFISNRVEDKAVDLHLIKQALEAKHFTIHKEAEKIVLDSYNSKERAKILAQLKKVEARGRYKKGS